MNLRQSSLFAFPAIVLLWSCPEMIVQGQSLGEVPGPTAGAMVIDHARVIPEFAKGQLERLCREIKGFEKSELVILTVQDTGNVDPEKYAIDYFNKWGIGEATNNNGLLVFAAMSQRTAYISIGEGLASEGNYRKCEEIAREVMVARFKRNDAAGAMFGGGFAAAREILGYQELADRLEKATNNERESNDERRLKKGKSPERKSYLIWLACAGVLGVGGFTFLFSRYKVRYGKRNCKNCQNEMVMLDEARDDSFLDPPEQIEERIGSVDYDVWACLACDHVLKYRYGKLLTRYSKCPRCRYKTRSKVSRTIRSATTSRGGKVRVTEDCKNCNFHKTYTYSTPKLPKPSPRRRSSGSGFTIGTGRSSGGGWGGGRSSSGRSSGGSFGGSRGSSRGGGGAKW